MLVRASHNPSGLRSFAKGENFCSSFAIVLVRIRFVSDSGCGQWSEALVVIVLQISALEDQSMLAFIRFIPELIEIGRD